MPKINVYLPDDLADAVKEMGVPVPKAPSQEQQALRETLAAMGSHFDQACPGQPTSASQAQAPESRAA